MMKTSRLGFWRARKPKEYKSIDNTRESMMIPRHRPRIVSVVLPVLLTLFSTAATVRGATADRPDVIIADFEGETYGDWTVAGEAFGVGPARGTLPGQMAVTGFLGRGLVNSFVKGDGTTGIVDFAAFQDRASLSQLPDRRGTVPRQNMCRPGD